MNLFLALQSGDWAALTIIIIILASVIGGIVKFYQAIKILKKGKPEIDPELAREQEREIQDDEQRD